MDWMSYRKTYFGISTIFIAFGILSILLWNFKIGVDFVGGTSAEYKFKEQISHEEVIGKLEENELSVTSVQEIGENTYLFKLPTLDPEGKSKLQTTLSEFSEGAEELRFESVGPSVGPELVKKTLYALGISALAILLWVAYQFKSFKFGVSAVLAMLHDSIILIGSFSLLGHFFGAEIDFLFASALLTVLAFSVHDTIVVYDRIREIQKKFGGSIYDIANSAVTETMVRSFNNSITIVFMLVALILLGGESIRWFAVALLVGTISGTYSSPFVAVPLLVVWEDLRNRWRKQV